MCEWYQDAFYYLKYGVVHITLYHNTKIRLKNLATNYIIIGDLLYRRSFDGALLICLMRQKVDMDLHQAHDDECEGHISGKFIYQKLFRLGYYWPTMLEDYELHIKKCEQCQKNVILQPYPSHALHSIVSPWPFSIWVLDFIGKINHVSRYDHKFIITAT